MSIIKLAEEPIELMRLMKRRRRSPGNTRHYYACFYAYVFILIGRIWKGIRLRLKLRKARLHEGTAFTTSPSLNDDDAICAVLSDIPRL